MKKIKLALTTFTLLSLRSMKLLTAILISLLMSNAYAASPEIWWAIRADCNIFMGSLNLHLEKVDVNSLEHSYTGSGHHNYETYSFPKCTNDDDSITCEGTSDFEFLNQKLKLVVSRNPDGTFKGNLNGRILGCLLSR